MLLSSLMFSSIRCRFYRRTFPLTSPNLRLIYYSFFILFRIILKSLTQARLNSVSRRYFCSSSSLFFRRCSIWSWYWRCMAVICYNRLLSFLMPCPVKASMTVATSPFSRFQSILRISALFLLILAIWEAIYVKPDAMRVCLSWNFLTRES